MDNEKQGKAPVAPTTFAVMEEELQVSKKKVATGVTRVTKKVHHVEQLIKLPLDADTVEINRVTIDRFIDEPVAIRTEGDVTIVPVMEEVLVVEKKLRLKQELHIRRHKETVTHTQKEVVRQEEVVVEHQELSH